MVNSILFICTGNTCRSPMAVALLRHMLKDEKGIELFSRGLQAWPGEPLSDGARQALLAAGVKLEPHRSQALHEKDIKNADLIFVMTQDQRHQIAAEFPEAKEKARLLGKADIADPMGGSPSDYEKCKMQIQEALNDLITQLKLH